MNDFLDKLKEGIDKGVTRVSVRSKEAIEAVKIKGQISALVEQKQKELAQLGGAIYDLYRQEADLDSGVKEECRRIADLDEEIETKWQELEQVHRVAREELGIPMCLGCGRELEDDDKFCRNCGRKVEE